MTKRRSSSGILTLMLALTSLASAGCRYRPDRADPPAEEPGPCRARELVLTAVGFMDHLGCRPTLCNLEADGSVTMSYCVDGKEGDAPWSICTVALNQDLNGFDPDHGGEGVLEVVFCTDQPIHGALDLWYGDPNLKREYQRVKFLQLLGPEEHMDVGCRTVQLAPEQAQIPRFDLSQTAPELRSQSLPQRCSGQCGDTPPECTTDFGRVSLTLAGEFLTPGRRSDAQIRLLSMKVLSEGCLCDDDLGCDGARGMCRANELASWVCAGHEPRQAGVCTPGGAAACGDMVGRLSPDQDWSGRPADLVSAAFLSAFARHDPALGCPFDNGGSPYVHLALAAGAQDPGVVIQDFLQPEESRRISGDGQSALVYDDDLGGAFLLQGRFWGCYKAAAYRLGLGAPREESHLASNTIEQEFEGGTLIQQSDGDAPVMVLTNASPGQPVDCSAIP